MILNVAIGFTAKVYYIALGPRIHVQRYVLLSQPSSILVPGAFLLLLAIACLSIGYISASRSVRLGIFKIFDDLRWSRGLFLALILVLSTVSLVSTAQFLRIFPVESTESLTEISSKRFQKIDSFSPIVTFGYLRWGASLSQTALYLSVVAFARSGRRWLSRYGAGVALLALLTSLFPIYSNSRNNLLTPLLVSLVIWRVLRGRLGRLVPISALLIVVVAIPTLVIIREGASSWDDVRADSGIGRVVAETVGGRHFMDVSKTSHIVNAVPERLSYLNGGSLLRWIQAPIPRSMWNDKPPISVGSEVGQVVFGLPHTSGVPPGLVAELYMNFGVIGVLIGMFLFGVLLKVLFLSFLPVLGGRPGALLYAVVVVRLAFHLPQNEVSLELVRLLTQLGPLLVALLLLRRYRQHAPLELTGQV